mgnify:CR=1 FL=1
MNRPTFLRRSTALLLTLVLMVCAALPGFAAYQMPIQTASDTESVYLFNLDTGKPILRQNSDQQRYIASLTKMMTALLFLESGKDMNAEITIPTSLTQEFKDIQNANGSTMNLRIGETVRRIDLLYGLLVASANDAASVIASDVSGGDLTAFVAQMNARAKELGCMDTTFTCVHGLYDYGNVSTAEDLQAVRARAEETLASLMKQRTILNVRKKKRQPLYAALADAEALEPSKALYEEGLIGMEQEFEQYMKAVKLLEDSGIPQEVLKKEKAEVYEQLSEVNREIRAEREKWKLCREICQQTPVMEQDIQKTEEHQKEVREHEHRRR